MADQPAVNSAKEFFEKVLPEGFAAGDHAASGENASLHYVITGSGAAPAVTVIFPSATFKIGRAHV